MTSMIEVYIAVEEGEHKGRSEWLMYPGDLGRAS